MIDKFAEFDEYQLAKHGKKVKKGKIPSLVPDFQDETEMEGTVDGLLAQKRFSVKRLIRLLHIKEPAFHVMAMLGKRQVTPSFPN